jgi:protein-tyrosine-phosphatase|tara:strand:- start:1538 stop:2185 length:648 start_codon:yes stop_codon:yes gene_type:complete
LRYKVVNKKATIKMSRVLRGPIPGQSFADKPGNYPWERPPETADPKVALSKHLKKMSGAKYMDSALYMMEVGLPVEVLTNTTLTMAVGRGIHSIDVGLIIAPAIHKEIVSIAEMAGIEYDEYFPEEEEEKEAAKERIKAVIIAKMKRKKPKEKTKISQTMEAMTSPETEEFEDMQDPQDKQEAPTEDMAMDQQPQQEESQEPPNQMGMGLMSREA